MKYVIALLMACLATLGTAGQAASNTDAAALIAQRVVQNASLRVSPQFPIDMARVRVTDKQIAQMFAKDVPLGFESPEQFKRFKVELNHAIIEAGLRDAEVGLKGTSTTFYSENPGKPLGHHWDKDPRNPADYDLDITSSTMVERFKYEGVLPSAKYNVFGTSYMEKSFPELDKFAKKWSHIFNRDVNFVGLPRAKPRDSTEYILRTRQDERLRDH